MKPRLFIGSSREGLPIAYAAQQNLQQDVEVTVWDQGVFQLSVSSLESLVDVLGTCDFALFVFSPDDILTIRGEESSAVRDNVIFELGLFIGVLGRERCFMLIPDKVDDLRIPTDLIGMAPATFETGRSDGSMQAATAPACHTIQQTIERLGMRAGRMTLARVGALPDETPEDERETDSSIAARKTETPTETTGPPDWLEALGDRRYAEAVQLLEGALENADTDEKRVRLDSLLGHAKYDLNPRDGAEHLEGVIARHPASDLPYLHLAYAHIERDLFVEAQLVVERGLGAVGGVTSLVQAKVHCLSSMGEHAKAEEALRQAIEEDPDNPALYLTLAEHYSDQKDSETARAVLADAHQEIPGNVSILERYAMVLEELPNKKLALVPYARLIQLEPDSTTYLTKRANVFLALDLNDLAMRDYKKASSLAEDRQAWILGNIGNLLKNRGFYREGIEYLKRAIELDPDSKYAHGRLAITITLRDEENERLQELLKEAKRELVAEKLGRVRTGED